MGALFQTNGYTTLQITFYFLGAAAWLFTYALVIRGIIKNKFVEFPAIIIAANVSWELLGGFVFTPLAFGGPILLWSWRAGAFMDLFMLYSCIRYGHKQIDIPQLKDHFKYIVIGAFLCFGTFTYFFNKAGYDLPMMFNSGMILNFMMSVFCITLFMRLRDRKFSPAIAWGKFFATSVFLNIYIILTDPTAYFSFSLGAVCFVLDVYYIVITIKRAKAMSA